MEESLVKIGLIQNQCVVDKRDNLDKIAAYIEQASAQGAKIISLQELSSTQYVAEKSDINHFSLAENMDGPTMKMGALLSKKFNVFLIVPFFEYDGAFYNSAAVFNPDGTLVGKYRKQHIPQNTNYQEKYYFRPGNLGFPLFKTPWANFGISICWDHWFPEVQRIYGNKGADIVFSPTAIGYCYAPESYLDKEYKSIWEKMLIGQAITGCFYFAVVNRVGQEGPIEFYGSSFVVSPRGEIVAQFGEKDAGPLVVEIDIAMVRKWRVHQQFARDRRPNIYNELVTD
jgi:N-carbamoylputrescine amidase